MSRRGFGRRRTVLQLEEGPNKREAYGLGYRPAPDRSREVNPIGGLDMMMHYEDSDEEEDVTMATNNRGRPAVQKFVASSERRLEPSSVVVSEAATSSQVTTVSNGRSVSPDTTKPKDEIDSKVLDFLAELDAIDGPDTTSGTDADTAVGGGEIDGEPLAVTPPHVSMDSTDTESYSSQDDDANKPPTEPTSDWQQCLDEGTQCYYYWHQISNEVTWEIPAEYSQYLLQYREYEELLAKYNKENPTPQERPSRKHKKKKRRRHDLVDDVPKLQTSEQLSTYGPELPHSSSNQPEPVQGPSLPRGPSLPPLPLDKPPLPPSEPQILHPQSSEQHSTDHMTPPMPVIGPQLAPPPPPPPEDKSPVLIGPELPSSSSGDPTNKDRDTAANLSEGDGMDDVDEYIHRKLEEPVYSQYEFVNKKYEGPQPSDMNLHSATENKVVSSVVSYEDDDEDDDVGLDIDDIDRELEKALERKQAELQSREVDSNTKRKAPVEDPVEREKSPKRMKTTGQPNITGESKSEITRPTVQVLKQDVKRKVESLAEVVELAELVTDKLDFLDITRTGLSNLQILLIQIQTRIEDWKEGGIYTAHFLEKLQDAGRQLEAYEANASPPGWSCHWDRKFKRYFYCSEITEETQWDYPVEGSSDEVSPASDPPPPPPPPSSHSNRHETPETTTHDEMASPPPQPPDTPPPPLPSPELPSVESVSSAVITRPVTAVPMVPESEVAPASMVLPMGQGHGDALSNLFTAPPPPPPPPPSDMHMVPPDEEVTPPMSSPQDNTHGDYHEVYPSYHPHPPPDPDPSQQTCNEADVDGVAMETVSNDGSSTTNTHDNQVDYLPVAGNVTQGLTSKPAHISADPVMSVPSECSSSSEHHMSYRAMYATDTADNEPGPSSSHSVDHVPVSLSPAPPTSPGPSTDGGQAQDGTTQGTAVSIPPTKEKKKKKEKNLVGRGLSMKKKNVTGLVQKWQKVQQEVEIEIAKQKTMEALMEKELESLGNG